ncbi:sensor histidine kinase [Microbacterium indicum]|uniref:sensor histidine kinase n=1 Tax=Microbacterium indicum TaxID=358100 RepID=UPI00041994D4|nr:sensor histidine kinase [Microbacterium indicum]
MSQSEPVPPRGAGSVALDLPRPPGVLRRWIDRHPRAVDVIVLVVTQGLFAPVALIVAGSDDSAVSGWLGVTLTALTVAVLGVATFFRRRIPFLLLVCSLAALLLPAPMSTMGGIASWVALYALGAHRSSRVAWLGYALAVVATAASTLPAALGAGYAWPTGPWIDTALVSLGSSIIPTLVGLWIGGRRRYERALIARAEDLARAQDERARLAVSEERTRIAREMHDIVSHSLTVMITLSEGAAAQAERGSDAAPDAMRRVADTGRDSLAEMRRLLGVLRSTEDAPELAPLPGSDDIGSLVDQFREAGMPVAWAHSGAPLPAAGGVALTAYRIVQESLTNVMRHAPGSPRVTVTTRVDGDRIGIVVDNDLTHDPMPSLEGSGRGIVGMRERAALHGGTAASAPRPDGRWRVDATLHTDPEGASR